MCFFLTHTYTNTGIQVHSCFLYDVQEDRCYYWQLRWTPFNSTQRILNDRARRQ